ncbi:MAG: adenylate/guanylate cyclase domain-containing protein [Chloroflexi bacterium]|nr:adenylate/guanylate cyclase domain-containing protein [Chloroflexota bacterium]
MNATGIHYPHRCKVCRTPIRGIRAWPYRLRGIVPFAKNPQLCNRCSKVSFPAVEQEITVLFADVRGFAALSERTPPERLRQLLNVLFAAASEILIQNDALIDKFLGDAIMALFNAPIPQPRHREAALRAAFALQERAPSLNLPFSIGIGLNTGIALTGNVGSGEVTDYTAVGDMVNVASRLSGLAGGCEILAGLATWEGLQFPLPPGYECERVSLQVKGREQAVEAYRIRPRQRGP